MKILITIKTFFNLHLKKNNVWQLYNFCFIFWYEESPNFLKNAYRGEKEMKDRHHIIPSWDATVAQHDDDCVVMVRYELCLSFSLKDIEEFKYHVIFGDLLFPHLLHDGLFKATFLGSEYEIQFSISDDNQVNTKTTKAGGVKLGSSGRMSKTVAD